MSIKLGLPPGSVVYIGDQRDQKVSIQYFDYNEQQFTEGSIEKLEECLSLRDRESVTWVNVDGVHDLSIIEEAGRIFNLHPLLLEDLVNTEQRPKYQDYGDHLFFTLKMLDYNLKQGEIEKEQISFILADKYVLSFQEHQGDLFDPVRDRIRNMKGKVRTRGCDYLIYALLDVVVDHYFTIIENLGLEVEDLEDDIISSPEHHDMIRIQKLKNNIMEIRSSVYPLREAILKLQKEESPLIEKQTQNYFSDVYDHTIQIMESIESYKDVIASLKDIYMSTLSLKMNQVMQMLTVISTIFIPLTFIVGVYGMNFKNMPELSAKYGYFVLWGLMGLIALGMILWFRRKKWL